MGSTILKRKKNGGSILSYKQRLYNLFDYEVKVLKLYGYKKFTSDKVKTLIPSWKENLCKKYVNDIFDTLKEFQFLPHYSNYYIFYNASPFYISDYPLNSEGFFLHEDIKSFLENSFERDQIFSIEHMMRILKG